MTPRERAVVILEALKRAPRDPVHTLARCLEVDRAQVELARLEALEHVQGPPPDRARFSAKRPVFVLALGWNRVQVWRRERKLPPSAVVYVRNARVVMGCTLAPDQVVALPGFEQREDAAEINLYVRIALERSSADSKRTARSHEAADRACGREWVCACSACREHRALPAFDPEGLGGAGL